MDLPNPNEVELKKDLENLEKLNRRFGGTSAVVWAYRRLTRSFKGQRLVMIDLCSGYGDHSRELVRQAGREGRDLRILSVDFQGTTLKLARQATPADYPILYIQADARKLPFKRGAADLVLCALALHHFSENEATQILREMERVGPRDSDPAGGGLAVLDLLRGNLAQFCIWLLTALVMREPMTRHDARLSSRRAFNFSEFAALAREAGWTGLHHYRLAWFRQALLRPTRPAA